MAGEASGRISISGTLAGITFGGTVSEPTGESPFGFQRDMPIGTNVEIDLVIDISELIAIVLESSTDCTLKTNSSGSPTDTITLKAKKPYVWQSGIPGAALILTGDVTKFYLTNAALTTLKIAGYQGVTPAV